MKDPTDGRTLASAWLGWSLVLDKVISVDLERLEMLISHPEAASGTVLLRVDPQVMAKAFISLVEEGKHFWPHLPPDEAAWVMLAVDLDECLASLGENEGHIELVMGKVAGIAPVNPHQQNTES